MAEQCLHPGGLDFTAHLIQKANLSCNAKILDAGCGAGQTVDWLLAQGFAAWGIDQQPAQVTPQICHGTLQQLPYHNDFFSAVISECTAFICGDTGQMLQECWRVLQPDGWLLLADVFFTEAAGLPQFYDGRPVTLPQWQEILLQSGFVVKELQDVSAAWKPFVIEQLWAGRTVEELWDGCLSADQGFSSQYKPQYFLLWAKKGEKSDGRTTRFDNAYVGIDKSGLCLQPDFVDAGDGTER